MNIFQQIRKQIVKNEIECNERKFRVYGKYPEAVIVWLTKNRVFKVANVKSYFSKGQIVYEIEYKDLYTGSDFLDKAMFIAEKKKERDERKGYTGEYANESVTTKFGHINDKYRYELEQHNEPNVEHLAPEDNACAELSAMASIEELKYMYGNDFREYLNDKLQEFYQENIAKDYEI